MADSNSTGTPIPAQRYNNDQIARGEHLRWMSTLDLSDAATMKAAHLVAMLEFTYGDRGDFEAMAPHLQDEYMWACSTVARELRGMVRELATVERRLRDAAAR